MMRFIPAVLLTLAIPSVVLGQASPSEPPAVQPPPTAQPPAAELPPAPVAPTPPAAQLPAPAAASGDPAALPPPAQLPPPDAPAPHWDASRDPRWGGPPPDQSYYGRQRPRRDERPRHLSYDGGPPPPGYQTVSTSIKGLWIPGLAVGTGTYLISLLIASIARDHDGEDRVRWLAVPVLGPWIALASGCPDSYTDYYGDQVGCDFPDDLLVLSGVLQAVSLTAVILGFSLERKYFVRTDYSELRVLPSTMARSGVGLVLDGRF